MESALRYICVHGHFYQPPRENPWLETVEIQDAAAPYHDWNERITAECYAVNGASRILNEKKQIIRILNNYARMSFNFGPTLLSWLEENAPRTYRMILEADRHSQERFDGHGSAMAQVYSHMIMPLASTQDKVTQIRWGIADFEHRFQRKPEGMWLAETAADSETLELLADHGILYTVLSPYQCALVRPLVDREGLSAGEWTETPNGSVNTTRPYLVRFPNGKSLAVFFYDGPRSRAIAFEGLLHSGEKFAAKLVSGFSRNPSSAEMVHVATDGESYGHHHRHGEMALTYALKSIEDQNLAKLTNYGQFLTISAPTYEAQIIENTSWSCSHGVERWRSDCGCNGGHGGWNQKWRAPLRQALDELRDALIEPTRQLGETLFQDVEAARDGYIEVILDRSRASVDRFFATNGKPGLSKEDRITALKLMEIQRQTQLMYTSCGWFFDDISGIETVQVISYASRAMQLGSEIFPADSPAQLLEEKFLSRLEEAISNDPAQVNGKEIYLRRVKKMQVGLEQVGAHYAISSVFGSYPEDSRLFCFSVHREVYEVFNSGRGRLALGRARVSSKITAEAEDIAFAVLHFGDQNITAGVKQYGGLPADETEFAQLLAGVQEAAVRADLPQVIRLFDGYFGTTAYSLTSLFTDEQRRILRLILNSTLWEVENSLCTIYDAHASLLHFLTQSGLPKPPALTLAAGFAINAGLKRALESDPLDAIQMRSLLNLAGADQVALDTHLLSYLADLRMKRAMVELRAEPHNLETLDSTLDIARALRVLPFELNLWQAQNIWYETLLASRSRIVLLASVDQQQWKLRFRELGSLLYISVEDLIVEEELPANGIAVSPRWAGVERRASGSAK
jgi:alpha-amylase/alpha-mannosidase (GH57 family)